MKNIIKRFLFALECQKNGRGFRFGWFAYPHISFTTLEYRGIPIVEDTKE